MAANAGHRDVAEKRTVTVMADRLTFEGNFCEIARCRETRWGKHCPDGACSQRKVWERLKEYEDALPADVAPVRHGEWVPFHAEFAGDIQYCSVCEIGFDGRTSYCPHCGAKMGGAE